MGSLKWHLFGIAYASENEFLAEMRRIGLRVLYIQYVGVTNQKSLNQISTFNFLNILFRYFDKNMKKGFNFSITVV